MPLGRRRLPMIGGLGFAVVSAFAAFAPIAAALIAARAALGFFGAMLMPATLSIIRNVFTDPTERRTAIAVWAAGFSGGAAGPIVGGVMLEHFWRGSVLLLAVPVLIPLLALGMWLIPESKDPDPSPIDPLSIVLAMATMAPIVWAVKEVAYAGVTGTSAAAVLVGLVSGALFVHRQLRRPRPCSTCGCSPSPRSAERWRRTC